MARVYRGGSYIEVELPQGYSIVPLTDTKIPVCLTRYKYAVYHYASLIGLIYADKYESTDTIEYTLTKWDHGIIVTSHNIQDLLATICTQHRMGIIQ